MRDITEKITTLREAVASAEIILNPAIISKIKSQDLPKKDIFPMAKAAALLAVKNTAHTIPYCHPIPIDGCDIEFFIEEAKIKIQATVKSINKTGCEMEALHAVSIAALTIYDMLKPLQQEIIIREITLLHKKGGKSSFANYNQMSQKLHAAIVVMSDSISKGTKSDKAGLLIQEKLQSMNITIQDYRIIPDDLSIIQTTIQELVNKHIPLIITTGGTGLSPTDVTPEAIKPLLDMEVPGIMEAARNYGQQRTPYSMLSRSLAGKLKNSWIFCLPGSTNGVKDTMNSLFPYILHIFKVAEGWDHTTKEYKPYKK